MKKILALILTLTATSAFADVSGGVSLVSDYFWRGVSQTEGSAAVQFGIEADKNGFYGGAWASTVDFGGDESIEYDFYGGYTVALGDLAIDLGVIQYNYDDGADSVEEWYSVLSYSVLSLGYYQDMDNQNADYVEVEVGLPFVKFIDASLRYGEFADDSNYTQLTLSKDLSNSFSVGLELVSEEAIDLDLSERVAVNWGWSF
jgi:uncharacterized protein (TIGR02001 family)